MKRVFASENLKITTAKLESFQSARIPAMEHVSDLLQSLIALRAKIRDVLKQATMLRLLEQNCHREVRAIEMPRELLLGCLNAHHNT